MTEIGPRVRIILVSLTLIVYDRCVVQAITVIIFFF